MPLVCAALQELQIPAMRCKISSAWRLHLYLPFTSKTCKEQILPIAGRQPVNYAVPVW